jgi:hypothetical protein
MFAFIVGLTSLTSARAATRICVEINCQKSDRQSLKKLILNELAHHPTHVYAENECQSNLVVELFEIRKLNILTARINEEVPVRYQFKDFKDLEDKLRTALSLVLSHDPVHLAEDITHYSTLQRAAHSVLKRGHNFFRLEVFQGIASGGSNATFFPGAAIVVSRGADHWQVYTRAYFSGNPKNAKDKDMVSSINTGADLGLSYEFNSLSNISAYVSAGLGLQYLRFKGLVDAEDPDSLDHRNDFGPTFHIRLGVRFLRIYDFDFDLFAAGFLPMFGADEDTNLGDFYSPSLQIGLGIGF